MKAKIKKVPKNTSNNIVNFGDITGAFKVQVVPQDGSPKCKRVTCKDCNYSIEDSSKESGLRCGLTGYDADCVCEDFERW